MTDYEIVVFIDHAQQQMIILCPVTQFRSNVIMQVGDGRIVHSLSQFNVVVQIDISQENLLMLITLADLLIFGNIQQVTDMITVLH